MRTLAITLVAIALAGCGKEAPSGTEASEPRKRLVERMHVKLKAAQPGVEFTITDDRTITAKIGEGEVVISLDNLETICTSSPEECADALDAHVNAFGEQLERMSETAPPPTREALRVVLKNTEWLAGVAEQVAQMREEKPDAPDNRLVTRKFHGDLHEVLVVDAAESVAMLTRADLEEMQLSPVEAFKAGTANHDSLPPAEDVEVATGVWGFNTQDSYAAARLLLKARWPERAKKVKGDLLAVAPARDLVYFTGTEEQGGYGELQQLVRAKLPTEPYPLSATVLRWTDEGWVQYP